MPNNVNEEALYEIFATAAGIDTEEIDDDTQLGSEGLDISSLAVYEIVERIEMEFNIDISDEDMEDLHLGGGGQTATVSDLKDLIQEKQASDPV